MKIKSFQSSTITNLEIEMNEFMQRETVEVREVQPSYYAMGFGFISTITYLEKRVHTPDKKYDPKDVYKQSEE